MSSNLTIPLSTRVPTVGVEPAVKWFNGKNSWGKNPFGKPLYRVIWSESRTWLLGGCWPDGAVEYRYAPYYAGRQEWVLEKWLSAYEYAGTRRDWERSNSDGFLAPHGIVVRTMGPYPTMGWYEHVYSFPADDEPNLDLIVPLLEEAKNYTLAQIKAGVALWHERQKKAWEDRVTDQMADMIPVGGYEPTNLNPAKPTADMAGLSGPEAVADAIRRHRDGSDEETKVVFTPPRKPGGSMGRPRFVKTEK
jgi:hypothetical protein